MADQQLEKTCRCKPLMWAPLFHHSPSGRLQQEAVKYAGFIQPIDFALEQRQSERLKKEEGKVEREK